MDGIAVKPLTVSFHEGEFLDKLNGENKFAFWFQLDEEERERTDTAWGPTNVQALNRYSYVHNNPLIHTDPSGHVLCRRFLCGLYDLYWSIKNASGTILYNLVYAGSGSGKTFVPQLLQGTKKWGLEHIVKNHWHSAGVAGKSRFASNIGLKELKNLISEASKKGPGWQIQGNSFVMDVDMGRIIGVDAAGVATSRMRMVVDSMGRLITAYPIP